MSLKHVNVVVIGSGAGGGVVAKELSEAGLDVVLLERGRWVTRQLDRVYGAAGSDALDVAWQEACLEVLRRVEWSDYWG